MSRNNSTLFYIYEESRDLFFVTVSVQCNYSTSLSFRQVKFQQNTSNKINVYTIKFPLYILLGNDIFFIPRVPSE